MHMLDWTASVSCRNQPANQPASQSIAKCIPLISPVFREDIVASSACTCCPWSFRSLTEKALMRQRRLCWRDTEEWLYNAIEEEGPVADAGQFGSRVKNGAPTPA